MNMEWLVWFMGGVGTATLVYVIVDLFTESFKSNKHKMLVDAMEVLKGDFRVEQDRVEGMKAEIRNLRAAYTFTSNQLQDVENQLKSKSKIKKKR